MMIGASLVTWVAGLAACCPLTFTSPAVPSSAACSLDLASPRRTSSASSRTRVVTLPRFPENLRQPRVYLTQHGRMLLDRLIRQPGQSLDHLIHTGVSRPRCVFPIHMR